MNFLNFIFALTILLTTLSWNTDAQEAKKNVTYEEIENAILYADFETLSEYIEIVGEDLKFTSNPKGRLALNEAMGLMYYHTGDLKKSQKAFDTCWEIVLLYYPRDKKLRHRILFGRLISSQNLFNPLNDVADYIDDEIDGYFYYHINQGFIYNSLERYGEAIDEFLTASDLCFEDVKNNYRWAILCYNIIGKMLAETYKKMGEYDSALEYFNDFQKMTISNLGENNHFHISSEIEKSRLYLLLGNAPKAQESLQTASEILATKLSGRTVLNAELCEVQGDIMVATGNHSAAYELFRKAGEIKKEFNQDDLSVMIKQMTSLHFSGHKDEADSLSDMIDERLDMDNNPYLYVEYICRYADMAMDNKLSAFAIMLLQTAMETIEGMFEDYNSRLKLQNSLGAAYIKAGDYANAVNLYTGIVTEEKKRAHDIFAFLPEGQRELYWKMKEPLMNNIFKLNQEGTVTVARGSVFEISKGNRNLTSSILYDASLLNKGLLLEAFLNMQRIIISSGDQELINAFNELRELKGSDPKRAEQLEQTIISKVSSYGDFMDFTRIGWQDVRDNLQANEAAIEFVVSETDDVSYYSAEILRKNYKEPQHVFLFAQKNEDKSLGKMNIYSNDNLYKKTWGKIEKHLKGCKDIYFAPVGEFYRIGMEYLLVNESVRINDIYNMHRLSSTKSIATRKDGNDLTSMTSAALYGGLDYNLDSENMEYYAYAMQTGMRGGTAVNLSNTRSLNEVSWGYLRGTADEVTGISGILEDMKCRTTLYTGGEGVEESFKMLDDKSPQVIHVATHGFFFEPSSDISVSTGLVFAGANNYGKSGNAIEGIDDGLLTSKEIAEMNLTGAELVVLSACQTGVGEISGEGVFGLQRGFKKACAETLLMSLWEVDDNATNELMTRFYSGLASGLDKHEALHEAQNHVMQTCGPDPSLWAGFILLD